MSNPSDLFKIITVSPNLIQIEVLEPESFKDDLGNFTIGSYLKISDEAKTSILALVQSYKIKEITVTSSENFSLKPTFILDAQPIGFLDNENNFKRGGQQIAIPPNSVEVASIEVLKKIYDATSPDKKFIFSTLAQNEKIDVAVDGDKFFGKHIAVVGSTGSGKSGTVAKILQQGIDPTFEQGENKILNNSHIIIFDLHGEYGPAFPQANVLSVDNMILPYWLMNSEELEEMFIESNESNSHNQVSQFKKAVILNKKKYNKDLPKVNYDTPVYFNIQEVCKFIHNHNISTKDSKTGHFEVIDPDPCIEKDYLFFESLEFKDKKTGSINGGPYHGEFDRFVPRLETKINDDRLAFLLHTKKEDGSNYDTKDFDQILKQFIGYIENNKSNVTILDLSGIPFEILSLVVSLVSRLIFDFCFHFKNIKPRDLPFLLVLEEAHNYIPQNSSSKYNSVKKSIERIAKEGRKYGLSLMIVSQRPSEISETIFSQCSNFVAMRLTNPSDQQYVRRLIPDNINAITDTLPILEKQEALILGDSIIIPTIVKIKELKDKPSSNDILFKTEWQRDWLNFTFTPIINKLKKVGTKDICEEIKS